MATQNFMSKAWKDGQAAAKKESKARRKPVSKKKKVALPTRSCDLCGRLLSDKAGKPYDNAVWCYRCLKDHSIYPTPCQSCDGFYHFPTGITEVTDPMHLAMIADLDRRQLERDEK